VKSFTTKDTKGLTWCGSGRNFFHNEIKRSGGQIFLGSGSSRIWFFLYQEKSALPISFVVKS